MNGFRGLRTTDSIPYTHRLKWTNILMTAGFPVTMSCIWSTFELKKNSNFVELSFYSVHETIFFKA